MLMFRIYCLIFLGIIITCIVGLILNYKIEKILMLDFIRLDKYIKTRKGLNLILKYDLCILPTKILIVILFIYSVLILSFIFTPYWILWYLLCMAIWTFSLKFIKNVNIKLIVFFFMLSFLFGFIPINGILSINRLIYFYPFFLLGNLCGKDKEKFMNCIKSFKKPILIFISICFLVILMFVFRYFAPNINISFFYGKSHYSSLSDFFGRFIAYFLGIACGFAVMLIIPDRHRTNSKFKSFSFSQIGSRTLSIYLLHVVFISLIKKIISLITPDTGLLLVIFLTFTLIIVYLTSLPIFNKVLNKIA